MDFALKNKMSSNGNENRYKTITKFFRRYYGIILHADTWSSSEHLILSRDLKINKYFVEILEFNFFKRIG